MVQLLCDLSEWYYEKITFVSYFWLVSWFVVFGSVCEINKPNSGFIIVSGW